MAFKIVDCDNVRENFSSSGTTITLGGAVGNSRGFSAVLSNGDTFFGVARKGAEISVGLFTYTASGGTVAQTSVFYSTNGNAAVNFSSGAGEIFMDAPSRLFDELNLLAISVASAATCDIGAVHGGKITITSTTTITSLGTSTNKRRFVKFTGALTLTHNATSLILPGGANITTANGDTAIFMSDSSGNWTCWAYVKATGKAVIGPASTDITDSTAYGRAALTSTSAIATIAAMAARNIVVNPAVDVSQELGTTGATLTNNTAKYTADQWEGFYNHGAATAVVTSGQVAAASFPSALSGFSFGHQIKATTAITSPANGDFARHRQKIEGYRVAKLGWGAAGAATITVALIHYSVASGVALARFSNSGGNRFFYHELTTAAGWNFQAFTVPGDTSGTWLTDNGVGLVVELFVCGKETTPQSSLDAWGSTAKVQSTNSGNLLGTNNNLSILTGVFIVAGSSLPIVGDMPGLMRPFDQELALCKRYWQPTPPFSLDLPGTVNTGAGAYSAGSVSYATEMRATPTVTAGGSPTQTNVSAINIPAVNSNARGFDWNLASTGAGRVYYYNTATANARL